MTLDGAIKYCKEEAEKYMEYGIETECYQCGKEHEQLAEWLTELKELREKIKKLEKELEVAKLINHAEFKTLCKYNHVGGSENG